MSLPIQKTLWGAKLDIARGDFKESPRNPFKLSVNMIGSFGTTALNSNLPLPPI